KKKTNLGQGATLHLNHGVCEFEHCGPEVLALIRKRAFQQFPFWDGEEGKGQGGKRHTLLETGKQQDKPATQQKLDGHEDQHHAERSSVPMDAGREGPQGVGSKRGDGVADYSTLFGRLHRPRHRASGGTPRSKTRRDRSVYPPSQHSPSLFILLSAHGPVSRALANVDRVWLGSRLVSEHLTHLTHSTPPPPLTLTLKLTLTLTHTLTQTRSHSSSQASR
ncbi:hypothetical protein CORC01_14138, partial [Colletotrichum orchidophilum]